MFAYASREERGGAHGRGYAWCRVVSVVGSGFKGSEVGVMGFDVAGFKVRCAE